MNLAYRLEGSGERVLVLSGSLGTTLEMWEPQSQAFARHLRVLRYDHPGHGGSSLLEISDVDDLARTVLDLLDELGLERVAFCGLSLGGAVGMSLALLSPERIEQLVLCCTSPRFGEPEQWRERAELVRREGVETVADAVVGRWFTPAFRDVERFRAMLASTPAEGYARCCEAVAGWDARGRLDGIAAPTLTIAGSDDPISQPADLAAVAAEIPGARSVVIAGARHLANVERPAELNRLVLEHVVG